MSLLRVLVVLLLSAAPILADEIVVTEIASPGMNPWMKTAYVKLYTSDLGFVSILRSYPLANGSPSAALMVGEALFVGEANCIGAVCAPQIVRYDGRNEALVFSPVLESRARAIRLSPRGDIVVATEEALIRFDRLTGAVLASHPLPVPEGVFVSDADVDSSGCTVAVSMSPSVIVRGNLCGEDLQWSATVLPASRPNSIRGIRFLPDGSMLAGGKTLYLLGRDGAVLRTFDAGEDGGCFVEPVDSGGAVVLGCSSHLMRLDLESGAITRRELIGSQSIATARPEREKPSPRRRAVRR